MSNNITRILASLAALSMTGSLVRADVVTLTDGSKLVGTVSRLEGGKIKVTTDFAGALEIAKEKIVSVETEEVVNVGLTTGDRLVGPIAYDPGAETWVVRTQMGPMSFSTEQVEAIWPKGSPSPEATAAEASVQERIGKWSGTLEAGALFTEGNTDILEARGAATLQHKSKYDLLKFYTHGQYGEQNDARSIAEVKGGAYFEHLFGERPFVYVRNEAEYDEFENLDLRYTFLVGGGYYWIKETQHELKTYAGVGYLHETYRDGDSRDDAQAEIGLDYMVDLTEWLKFTHTAAWYPTFDSLRDYRLLFDTAFLMPLGTSDKWKLKLGATHEYDAIPQPGLERLDQTYYANILLELK